MKSYRKISAIERLISENLTAQEICDAFESLAKTAHPCLAKFVARVEGDPNRLEVLGTGFSIDFGGEAHLVTAHHVLISYNQEKGGGILLGDDKILAKSITTSDLNTDLAWIKLGDNVTDKSGKYSGNLKALTPYSDSKVNGWKETSSLLVIGFPRIKNVLDVRKPKSTLDNKYQYFCHKFDYDEDQSRIEISYDQNVLFSIDDKPIPPLPDPYGLSGSAALMIVFKESENQFQLGLRVIGVVVAWNTETKRLIIQQIGDPLK